MKRRNVIKGLLAGLAALFTAKAVAIPKTAEDPLGQRGYVNTKWWYRTSIHNDGWADAINKNVLADIEKHGVSSRET